jgi:uncharacterized protein YceK
MKFNPTIKVTTMNKLLLVFALTLVTSGCGWFDRKVAAATGYSKTCVDGVEYIQFTSGATVAYTREGKVKTCN